MKSPGQIVYEHKNPPQLRVVLFEGRAFATADDAFLVPNERHVPWRFLTESCRQSWEQTAVGHYLVTPQPLEE